MLRGKVNNAQNKLQDKPHLRDQNKSDHLKRAAYSPEDPQLEHRLRTVQDILADKQAKISQLLARQELGVNLPQALIVEDGSGVLLALTGKDFRALDFDALLASGKRVSTILALDDEAAVLGHFCGIPVEFVEDILGTEATREAQLCGRDLATEWYKPFQDTLTADGIVWPQLDQTYLRWFWMEANLGLAVAKAMHKQNREMVVLCRTPYLPPEYYYGEDNFGRGAMAAAYPCVSMLEAPAGRRYPARIKLPWDKGLNNVAGAIVCVLNTSEIDRSKDVLHDLAQRYPGKVCVLALGHYDGNVNFVPIYETPISTGDTDDGTFVPFMGTLAADNTSFDPALLRPVRRALRQCCSVRWPSLRAALRSFRQLFERYRPLCVLGTDLDDAESQLAFCAARQLSIPTVAWGHAFINAFRSWQPQSAEKVMVPTGYGLRAAKAAGVPQNRHLPVYGIERDKLYPTAEGTWPPRRHGAEWRILVLPFTMRIPGTSLILGSLRTTCAQIHDLCSIPSDLQDNICLRFKYHPWIRDDSPFLLNKLNRNNWCFPNKVTLIPILDDCDCCILLGESSCAVLESCSRVPTLLITEDRLCFFEKGTQEAIFDFPHQSDNIAGVWDFIRALRANPDLRGDMLERQRSWGTSAPDARHWLDCIDDAVHQVQ